MSTPLRHAAVAGGALLGLLAAGGARAAPTPPQIARAPEIRLVVPDDDPDGARIEVRGLPREDLTALREAPRARAAWTRLLAVRVHAPPPGDGGTPPNDRTVPASTPPVLGTYAVDDAAISFTPMFPLDPGREYSAAFDPTRLPRAGSATPEPWRRQPIVTVVARPAAPASPPTRVARIYPSASVLPENQLKLYVHFSAPMSASDGLAYLRLLTEQGDEVNLPFLPLGAEFWDRDHLRYTVFFDPGRIKQGVLPNEQLGRSISNGRRYTVVVDPAWPDAHGNPLAAPHRKAFSVGPPDEEPIDLADWELRAPTAGTRDELAVSFPEPLDHGLLQRTLGIRGGDGRVVEGDVTVTDTETRWVFSPRHPWTAGRYELVALTILEDLAGNQIGKAFEIDVFERAERPDEREALVSMPFQVR